MQKEDGNRPSDRFLGLSICFTIGVVIFFIILGVQTRRCHNDIVNLYCAESSIRTTDNNVELDKAITSLLQLEVDKIQQSMIILSVWAGVMMIVFLVFSLYSMHRSDELEKESRESLTRIQEEANVARQRADASLKEIAWKSKAELEMLSKKIAQSGKEYEEMAAAKQKEFDEKLTEYQQSLDKAAGDFSEGIKRVISVLNEISHDINEGEKDTETD